MSPWLLILLLSAPPEHCPAGTSAAPEPSSAQVREERSYHEIRQDMHKLLRQEAVTQQRDQWRGVVVRLAELYGEIVRDKRLPASDTLSAFRVQLRSRLLKIQKRLERDLAAREDGSQHDVTNSPGAAGGAALADYGGALVELIQRTIAPEFWDVNGGPGTIVYYRQWQALVVRATGDIHEKIGGTVEDLRK